MTYDAREKSRYGGQPIEGFKFVQGNNSWFYTSADREIVLPAGSFSPTVISRTELDFSQEDTGESVDVSLPRDNPVVELFIGDLPSTPVWITIYRAHRNDESLAVTIFAGRVIRAHFEESQATLRCASLLTILNRSLPILTIQTHCNHVLFSVGCGVNPTVSRDSITIATVTGATIVSADFALRADQWFRSGRLENPQGETRFIVDHVGDTIELFSAMPGLGPGNVVWAYWGCDHLEATCANKFSNLDNHLGWSRLPGRNPFDGRID